MYAIRSYYGTGHTEAVQVYFDPEVVTYKALLDYFWRHINPTDAGGQFVDRGNQYRSEIFYHTGRQKMEATASKKALRITSYNVCYTKLLRRSFQRRKTGGCLGKCPGAP